jgi:hypothetical protein
MFAKPAGNARYLRTAVVQSGTRRLVLATGLLRGEARGTEGDPSPGLRLCVGAGAGLNSSALSDGVPKSVVLPAMWATAATTSVLALILATVPDIPHFSGAVIGCDNLILMKVFARGAGRRSTSLAQAIARHHFELHDERRTRKETG